MISAPMPGSPVVKLVLSAKVVLVVAVVAEEEVELSKEQVWALRYVVGLT